MHGMHCVTLAAAWVWYLLHLDPIELLGKCVSASEAPRQVTRHVLQVG